MGRVRIIPAPELGAISVRALTEMQSHTPVGSYFASGFLRAGKIGHLGWQNENFGKLTPCPAVLAQFQHAVEINLGVN